MSQARMTDRIAQLFERTRAEGRPALIAFVPGGWPEPDATPGIVRALLEGGADAIELGVPFSDPLADGVTNQAAYQQALDAGVTQDDVLASVRTLREEGVSAPLLLMGYFNPMLAAGTESFARTAAEAGVDGLVVVDLPVEEASELAQPARAQGVHLVYLLAPTSTAERIAAVGELGSGFVYCVSVTGVTGSRAQLPEELPAFIARVREHATLPLAVGFGISAREHVEEVGRIADAAIVGSAVVQAIREAPREKRHEAVRGLMEQLSGRAAAKAAAS
ncbi:MAG: tryptophan synthase subunit alpha [Chloroflexi bacterium]|nr:tryptophan synthase subunit alpha [Chloroflexota bacterium]